MSLQGLDARVVRWAAERLAKLVAFGVVRRVKATAALTGLSPRTLRALDDRYANRGPLGMLREVPQLGFVVIGLVFLAGAGTAVSRQSGQNNQIQTQAKEQDGRAPVGTGGTVLPGLLGPSLGEQAETYLTAASLGLQRAGADHREVHRLALVSLTGYLTPAEAQRLFSGIEVRRVYLRAQAAGSEAAQLPVEIKSDLLGELLVAYQSNAARRLTAQKEFQNYVDTIAVTTPDEQAFKDQYAAFARSTGIEAQAYGTGCACVYAAVVESTQAMLLEVASRPGVRGVQIADAGEQLTDLEVSTLLPETTTTVPARPSDTGAQ